MDVDLQDSTDFTEYCFVNHGLGIVLRPRLIASIVNAVNNKLLTISRSYPFQELPKQVINA
jgi:hypothetical protein